MRLYYFRNIAVLAAIAAVPLCSVAQETGAAPPPQLEQLDEGDQPAITIRKPATEREITEKREHGRVTEVKVRSGRSTYYLHPNDPAGSAMRGDTQSDTVRPAEWVVHEFDIGRKAEEAAEGQGPDPATGAPDQ